MESNNFDFDILPAQVSDAVEIHRLINRSAKDGIMLPRSLSNIYDFIRDFLVCYDSSGGIIGVCSLHICWEKLAEIRSLAVDENHRHRNIGKHLVERSLEDATRLGVNRVFVLTYVKNFFIKMGFHEISKSDLPHKVWADCIHCAKFPDCDEEALAIDLKTF